MHRFLILSGFLIGVLTLSSQYTISGTISTQESEPLEGAIVRLDGGYLHAVSNSQGYFELLDLTATSHQIQVSYVGYKDYTSDVQITSESKNLDVLMESAVLSSPEIMVSAYRATQRDPMAYAELDKVELIKRNLGMDVPELLNTLPSVFFSSDAGNGIGYTYLRLRGNDQTNINVTINGVPLNDAESQGVFWVNLPDLTASTENIQVQRGVGTSTNGAGAFGGSINFLTQGVNKESFAKLDMGVGSFNTLRSSIGFGTGLLDEQWSLEGRLSQISSDGYIDRSQAKLQSYFLSGGLVRNKTSFNVLVFGGREETQQAWWGVPRARLENDEAGMIAFAADNGWSAANTQNLLDSDRRFNYYTYDQEVDDYGQDHVQLHVSHKLNSDWRLNASAHYTKGKGFFEQFQDTENAFDDTDFAYYGINDPIIGTDTLSSADFVRRRWLDNDFYGAIASAQYEQGKWKTIIGTGWNRYEGNHFGEVIWASVAGDSNIRDRYYENAATKEDRHVYVKTNYRFMKDWDAYVDLQSRAIDYRFTGPTTDGDLTDQTAEYQFFNPKAGLSYSPNEKHRVFTSYAIARKEPNRDDHVGSTVNSRPKAQRLADLEIGYSYRAQRWAVELVGYDMQYNDQLINTGQINDVGENIRTNVAKSYRRGGELILNVKLLSALSWSFNANYSKNIIKDHVEYVTDFIDFGIVEQQLGDVRIAYSPEFISSSSFTVALFSDKSRSSKPQLDLSLITKYVGEQFLDNTETAGRTIDAFMTNDIRLDLSLQPKRTKALRFTFLLRNVLDSEYASNGWTYRYLYDGAETSFDALFPQAGINFLTGFSLEL